MFVKMNVVPILDLQQEPNEAGASLETPTRERTRSSLMLSRIGVRSEKGRNLDCCWRERARRKATPSLDPSRLSFRHDGLDYGKCLHNRSYRRSLVAPARRAGQHERLGCCLPIDGG